MRRFSAKVFLGVGVVCYGLILLGSRWFFLLFAPADPELVGFAVEKSVLYFSGFFLTGFNILVIAYWQAVQQTGWALAAAVLRSVVLPPLLLLVLPTLLEREIIWVCQSAADALTACCIMFALTHMDRRQRGRP